MNASDTQRAAPGILDLAKISWKLAGQDQRKKLFILGGLMVVVALMEFVALVAIQMFLEFVVNGSIKEESWLADYVTTNDPKLQLFYVCGVLGTVVLAKLVIGLATFRRLAITVAEFRVYLSVRLFKAYISAPMLWHLERNTAHLQRNLTQDIDQATNVITQQFLQLLLYFSISMIVMCFVVATMPAELLIVLVATGLLLALVGKISQRILRESSRRGRTAIGKIFKLIREGMLALSEFRILAKTGVFTNQFVLAQREFAWAQKRRVFVSMSVPLFLESITTVCLIIVVAFLILISESPEAAFATATILTVALLRLRMAINRIVGGLNTIASASAALPPLSLDLDTLEPLASNMPTVVPQPEHGFSEFLFEAASFQFPNQQVSAICDLDLAIKRGEDLAIMGQTGAGKSTFLSMLLGLLEPTSGRLLMDGNPLKDSLSEWSAQLGYVPQSVFLIDDTIARNVAFGVPDAQIDQEQVKQALSQAQAMGFVEKLPDGIHTMVGEAGSALSGGQRQRIGIARALYRSPTVIVLDEATSALDRDTQLRLLKSIHNLPQNPTVISVTHQLEPLEFADKLILLESGKLAASGTVTEVRQTSAFERITRTQDEAA